MEVKRMTCINCPLGCSLEVTMGEEITVSGNKCKRGKEYALVEITDPKRIITSTVRVKDGEKALVSVKTDKEISKKLIFDAMKVINSVVVEAPVKIGDIIVSNILDTDVNIVATSNVGKH